MAPSQDSANDIEKEIFAKISNNSTEELKVLLATSKIKVNFLDENCMTPLQHACYKGNLEIVQMLLDHVGYVAIL